MSTTPFGYQDKILLTRPQVTDLLQLAARRGVSAEKLLSGTTIFPADLHKPQHRIHSSAWLKFMQQCQQLQSPELPFLTASALLQNTDIPLCTLLQHANNLQQALKYLLYFRHQLVPYLFVRLQQQPNSISLELLPAIGLGAQQQFVCEVWLSLLLQLIKQQLGSTQGCQVSLRWPAPKTASAYQALWPAEVCYQQPCTAIQINRQCWQQPFRSAEPGAFHRALQTCRQQNLLLAKQRGVLEFAWRQLSKALPALLTQEQLAQRFGISVSALKRLLQQHHTSYSQLLDEVRNQLALSLLSQQDLSNRQLAERLGYSDEHNFRRAFKRWTGAIPSAFRLLE